MNPLPPPSTLEKLQGLPTPPADTFAEASVLASCLINPDCTDDAIAIVTADDFHDDAHRKTFSAIADLTREGKGISLPLLKAQLQRRKHYEQVGGIHYLESVLQTQATAAHVVYYARLVRDCAIRRGVMHACTKAVTDAYDDSVPADDLLAGVETSVLRIGERQTSDNTREIGDILKDSIDRVLCKADGGQVAGTTPTGYSELDRKLGGGMHAGELVVLAARPSMGKTALAINISAKVAIEHGDPVFFQSLEMGALEVGDRLLSCVGEIRNYKIRDGYIDVSDRDKMSDAAERIASAPLSIDDSPSRTVSQIAASARRVKRRAKGLALVVVDYLQLIAPDDSRQPREQQVSTISRRLKQMARDLGCPVLCLAQLNRQSESTADKEPQLHHLRESGAIEQDADVVMFVHRDSYYRTTESLNSARVIVRKQRNGPTGDVPLVWFREYMEFRSAAADETKDNYEPDFKTWNDGGFDD